MKERIQEKAAELFLRFGIRSVTMDEIASQLGISKKTIYQSFADKDELVTAVFEEMLNNSKNDCIVDRSKSDNAVHELFLAMDLMEDLFKTMNPYVLYDLERYHPAVFAKFLEFKNGFLLQAVKDNLEWGIKEELYRPEINVDTISRYRIGTAMISMNVDVFPNNKFNVLQVEQHLLLLYAYGIASPKGIKLIQKYNQQREQKKA
ncbi:TetR/AcrR family transcriptional regulator [Filimonas effusa]|nr:TetR/AcrR family transcriptional regulator [Filimonas effusa]